MADKLFDAEAFWQFSCELYLKEGVKDLCLHCQDKLGLNVNLLLFCAWLTRFDASLNSAQWQTLLQAITHSESRLRELRGERKSQVKNAEQYKTHLQQELELEAQQQRLVVQAIKGFDLKRTQEQPLTTYFAATACEDKSACDELQVLFNEANKGSVL